MIPTPGVLLGKKPDDNAKLVAVAPASGSGLP